MTDKEQLQAELMAAAQVLTILGDVRDKASERYRAAQAALNALEQDEDRAFFRDLREGAIIRSDRGRLLFKGGPDMFVDRTGAKVPADALRKSHWTVKFQGLDKDDNPVVGF